MEETAVSQLLHQRGWRTAFTVADRVNSWARMVTAIENGYRDDVDEYSNDLYCRNWLHEAWLLLDDHSLARWNGQVRRLDGRFRAATIDDDGYVLSQFHGGGHPEMWWWRRYPRILTGALGEALHAAGADCQVSSPPTGG
ncbi:hypothetical protein [Actinoplanes sp. NPDC026619]|uniref:hypothetical protein n=1 Tax=Actinoplanes sp. NPDC026619 TaxID=3155798 RepID=UPI003407AFE1